MILFSGIKRLLLLAETGKKCAPCRRKSTCGIKTPQVLLRRVAEMDPDEAEELPFN